jgi:hypothetical protein
LKRLDIAGDAWSKRQDLPLDNLLFRNFFCLSGEFDIFLLYIRDAEQLICINQLKSLLTELMHELHKSPFSKGFVKLAPIAKRTSRSDNTILLC